MDTQAERNYEQLRHLWTEGASPEEQQAGRRAAFWLSLSERRGALLKHVLGTCGRSGWTWFEARRTSSGHVIAKPSIAALMTDVRSFRPELVIVVHDGRLRLEVEGEPSELEQLGEAQAEFFGPSAEADAARVAGAWAARVEAATHCRVAVELQALVQRRPPQLALGLWG